MLLPMQTFLQTREKPNNVCVGGYGSRSMWSLILKQSRKNKSIGLDDRVIS